MQTTTEGWTLRERCYGIEPNLGGLAKTHALAADKPVVEQTKAQNLAGTAAANSEIPGKLKGPHATRQPEQQFRFMNASLCNSLRESQKR